MVVDILCAHLHRSSYWNKALKAVAAAGPTWRPPSSESLRTTLLDEAKERVRVAVDNLKDKMVESGVTLTSDSWTNVAG